MRTLGNLYRVRQVRVLNECREPPAATGRSIMARHSDTPLRRDILRRHNAHVSEALVRACEHQLREAE